MAKFVVHVVVTYQYEVEALNEAEAEQMGWDFDKYSFSSEVYSIDVHKQEFE